MHQCTDCGRTTDNYDEKSSLCEDCKNKRNESQDERRHDGDERHGKI